MPPCVKRETRASCVDPIEAKAFDLSRGLYAFFNHRIDKAKLSLLEFDDAYDDFYDPRDNIFVDDVTNDVDTSISSISSDISHVSDQLGDENDEIDIIEKLRQCRCDSCSNGNSWLDIFGSHHDEQPHRMLLKKSLCPEVVYEELSLDDDKPFKMHRWRCGI